MFGEFKPTAPEDSANISSEVVGEGLLELHEELLADCSEERAEEIKKSGRVEIYDDVAEYLKDDDVRKAFALVNYAPTIVDDAIDKDGNVGRLLDARTILNESFNGKSVPSLKSWEQRVFDLGTVLSRLDKRGFEGAEPVLCEVINYWIIEKHNLDRMGEVLDAEELDELNMNIGKSIGIQFLHLLTPKLDKDFREQIATEYGFAIKLADNLSDLDEDFKQGFINISREDIEKYNLDVSNVSVGDLRLYMQVELERAKRHYEEGDELTEDAIEQHPECEEGLVLFKRIAHSWLNQTSEIGVEPE